MEKTQINPRFFDYPHGDIVYINQLYGYQEHLQTIRYEDAQLEEERRRLLNAIESFLGDLDRPMRIVVAGGFNAGKSTFLNALIAREVMPAYMIRTTGTVNCLVAGTRQEFTIFRIDGEKETRSYENDDHLREQIEEIMKSESTSIDHIDIACPIPFLEKFTLIDTPGLDHNEQDSAASLHEIERADALIWLLSNQGLRKEDNDNLKHFNINNPDSPIIVIINQIDDLDDDDRESVLRTVRTKLKDRVHGIFPLSAKDAFIGRREADALKMEQSCFYELNQYIHDHLFSCHSDLQALRLRQRSQDLLHKIRNFLEAYKIPQQPSRKDFTLSFQSLYHNYQDKIQSPGKLKNFRITMLGGEDVGKTSVLASIYEHRNIIIPTGLQFYLDHITDSILMYRLSELKEMAENFSITGGIGTTTEQREYVFDLGLIDKPPELRLTFEDLPRRYINHCPEKIIKFIVEADVILLVIHVPAIIEDSGRWQETINHCQLICHLFKHGLQHLEENSKKLLLLVPAKCESYVQSSREAKNMLDRVKEEYKYLTNFLSHHEKIAVVVTPIQTLGSVRFSHIEEQEGFPNFLFTNISPKLFYQPKGADQILHYIIPFVIKKYLSDMSIFSRIIKKSFNTQLENAMYKIISERKVENAIIISERKGTIGCFSEILQGYELLY